MDKNDITLNYAFQEYIPEKDLENKGIKDVAPVLTYEEPRWTFKNTSEAMNIIKESDASLYEKIQDYVKEQHLPSENILYLDFGKSLRYDDEYMGDFSKETLEYKLDNLFIVRYSHDNDDGNLIDGGDEIVINDNETVSLLNGMIEEHIKENIKKYEEYKIKKNSLQKNQTWIWKDYDDLSGHLEAPDGTQYFSYDWTTKEYKVNPDKESWDSFLDADPTRDTSLSAFKDYAQNYIKNNIVKDKSLNIVFERNYIDTEKLMEEEEKKMAENETLADKYNRIEKLFEGKTCRLGNGEPQDFKELYDWVQEEFPEKDSEGVLFEATSRMIEENLDFGEFNYQAFDDVYGFGGGAEWRLDFSDSAAKKLISGEILTLSDAQSLIWEKAENEFAALKENPQYKDEIEITDRINSAFRIADFLYPEFTKEIDKEKNLLPDEWPQYSNEEKKTVINNAFEKIKSAFDEKKVRLSDSRTDELVFEGSDKWLLLGDFKALIKGKDAAEHGKESLSYIRPNAEQLHDGIENGWEFDEITTGYAIFQNQDLDVKGGFTPKFISKINDMNVFESDGDAAKQYGIDNNCRILEEKKDIWIGDEDLEYYSYPDIPENRRIMKENGWLLEQPLEFDFSEFTEKDFNRIRDELFKDNPKEDYYGRLHIGSLHVEFVINQNDGWVDTNYYILGEKGEGETQFGVPYGHFPGHQFIANLFTDNTYEEFKEKVTKAVLDDIAEEGTLKPEAMRPLVDWNDEQQCNELYHTKLVESARVNEIVIAPYSREERDVEAVRDFVSKIVNLPVLGVPDDMVFAVLDNIGRVQDENPGDFLKIRKDGSVEHISALGPVEKEPVEVLHIINSFAEDHASVSEEGSQQRKDYEEINSLSKKAYEKHMRINESGFNPSEYVLNELKEHGRTGLQTVKALAYKNVMDKNYLAYDNRLEKSGSEADKIQSAIESLTDVSLPAVAGEIGKSEQEVAEIISALLDAKDYVEERFNVVRPTADEIIEKVRDEVSWADILKTELSWKELGLNPEDYDRTESGTETEKDFKEWAMGLELENTLDLHGFDTALEGVSSWNNSTISEQKWMIIDKLSEEIVSGKLKIENSQDAFDKLLKENEVYKDFVQKGIVKDDAFGLREITEKEFKSVSAKEPVDIIKEIATQKELAEVPELFTREFKYRMKTRFPGPEKDPFIVAKAIINDWKTSKPDYTPALNKWLSDSLKKEGFSTKENLEKGFEKFFKKLSSPEQKRMQHKDSDIGQGR